MEKVALIMLASGLSRRYGAANKLLADLQDRPVASHTANLWARNEKTIRIAVLPPDAVCLENLYKSAGWTIQRNSTPAKGLSSSIGAGISAVIQKGVSHVIICLAEMPFIDEQHLTKMADELESATAVMSQTAHSLLPPAGFSREHFQDLQSLTGDRGAKSVFLSAKKRASVPLGDKAASDVDTPTDLERLQLSNREYSNVG